MTLLGIFGIDIGDLVADLLRALLDLLIPDFASRWGSHLASWLVALPNVTDRRQFGQLNDFRQSLAHVAWGLLSLSFAVGALQYWLAGFADTSRAGVLDAARRAVFAAGALAVYPTLIAQLVLAVNHLTAAVVRHPKVVDGLDLALGGALALGAVSGGLSLGLALAAVLAAVFFLAAIVVMKIALTVMLCVLAVSGALVIALYPLPQGEGLARLWLSGLVCCVVVPVAWALIFAVAGLVSADALAWSDGLGEGLAALVKPFVAVACLYVAFRAPALLVAQARLLGLRLDAGALRSSPGEQRLRSVAHRQGVAYRDRFAGLGAMAVRPAAAGAAGIGRAAVRQTGAVGRSARRAAVNLAAAAGGNERRGERVVAGVEAAGGAVRAAGRTAWRAADWWRQSDRATSVHPSDAGQSAGVAADPRPSRPPLIPDSQPRVDRRGAQIDGRGHSPVAGDRGSRHFVVRRSGEHRVRSTAVRPPGASVRRTVRVAGRRPGPTERGS